MLKKLIVPIAFSYSLINVGHTAELGPLKLNSVRNSPFDGIIPIGALSRDQANEKMKVKLGAITDFYRYQVDYMPEAAKLNFRMARNARGEPYIKVSSDKEVDARRLKLVVKLSVGREKVYGTYDFSLPVKKMKNSIAYNLINTKRPEAGEDGLAETSHSMVSSQDSYFQDMKSRVRKKQRRDDDLQQSTDAIEQSLMGRFPVRPGHSISQIAMEVLSHYPEFGSWRMMMRELVSLNPQAFVDGDINRLRSGVMLTLPEKEGGGQPVWARKEEEEEGGDDRPSMTAYRRDDDQDIGNSEINSALARFSSQEAIPSNHFYDVREGDCLSMIAYDMMPDFPEMGSWRTLMAQLAELNPNAFINGNIHLLRADVKLRLPSKEGLLPAAGIPDKPVSEVITEQSISEVITEQSISEVITEQSISEVITEQSISEVVTEQSVTEVATVAERVEIAEVADNHSSVENTPLWGKNGQSALSYDMEQVKVRSYENISKTLEARANPSRYEDKSTYYEVPKGRSISLVAIELLPAYPEYDSWPTLMRTLYVMNPDAFVDNDINQLRANVRLRLPDPKI